MFEYIHVKHEFKHAIKDIFQAFVYHHNHVLEVISLINVTKMVLIIKKMSV
jgi:hypothetical protein